MNTKTAKRLRRAANYHPTQPRQYEEVVRSPRKAKAHKKSLELTASCSRYLYQELKKEYYANK